MHNMIVEEEHDNNVYDQGWVLQGGWLRPSPDRRHTWLKFFMCTINYETFNFQPTPEKI
jgi:hypothetical protein